MRLRSLVLALLSVVLLVVTGEAAVAAEGLAVDPAVSPPPHQVVAIYFHRTNRCPTCKRISSYIDEAIKTTFADELKTRTVEWHMVDFQDGRNQRLVESYKISSPTLVLADIRDGKVETWMPMPKVWTLVRQKGEFFRYVQEGIVAYLKGESKG